jgi:hypothetical protein
MAGAPPGPHLGTLTVFPQTFARPRKTRTNHSPGPPAQTRSPVCGTLTVFPQTFARPRKTRTDRSPGPPAQTRSPVCGTLTVAGMLSDQLSLRVLRPATCWEGTGRGVNKPF